MGERDDYMMRMSPESEFIWLAFMARFLSSIIFFLEKKRKMLFQNWGEEASVSKDGPDPETLIELFSKNISNISNPLREPVLCIRNGFNADPDPVLMTKNWKK